MHNEILDSYIKNPNVLYVYEIGLQIYGLFQDVEDRDFVIIYNELPDDAITNIENEYGSYNFQNYSIKEWFDKVLSGDILAWECSCLNKKFIHKEHVKLLLEANPLQLRKQFEELKNNTYLTAKSYIEEGNSITGQKLFWNLLKFVMFSNQIIENHKIVNFKESTQAYKQIVNGQVSDFATIIENFMIIFTPHFERLKRYTDAMLAKSKIKFINQDV